MIKITEDFCNDVFFESILQKFVEETGERYANAIKVVFNPAMDRNYNEEQMHKFNDVRYKQENDRTKRAGLAYFEGKNEKEFKDEFWEFIDTFVEANEIESNDKNSIKEFLMDYIDRLCLEGVKEVRKEDKIKGAIARLDRKPLYHYKKQH